MRSRSLIFSAVIEILFKISGSGADGTPQEENLARNPSALSRPSYKADFPVSRLHGGYRYFERPACDVILVVGIWCLGFLRAAPGGKINRKAPEPVSALVMRTRHGCQSRAPVRVSRSGQRGSARIIGGKR